MKLFLEKGANIEAKDKVVIFFGFPLFLNISKFIFIFERMDGRLSDLL